jgi:Uma2 family endonuclease
MRRKQATERAGAADIAGNAARVVLTDPALIRSLVRLRRERDIDRRDEVWDGTYTILPAPWLRQQDLVGHLLLLLHKVVVETSGGCVLPDVCVSDRRTGWESNYRMPDLSVVLPEGRAVDCVTHFHGGPDFLVEIDCPGSLVDEKIPFYSKVGVRELLVIDRDTRHLRPYRHDGHGLTLRPIEIWRRKEWWWCSEVIPVCFRRKAVGDTASTEIGRMDKRGIWTI